MLAKKYAIFSTLVIKLYGANKITAILQNEGEVTSVKILSS